MKNAQIIFETVLEAVVCGACGVTFGMPEELITQRRRDHQSFYCPNGHGRFFPDKTDAEKVQAAADKYKKLYQQEQKYAADVVSERNAAQRSLSATKGVLTRTKNRIANGVCPCCHRSFKELQRHMEDKHPGYEKDEAGDAGSQPPTPNSLVRRPHPPRSGDVSAVLSYADALERYADALEQWIRWSEQERKS